MSFAVYFDELAVDPEQGIQRLKNYQLHQVILRRAWKTPIHLIGDSGLSYLKKSLQSISATVELLDTTIGDEATIPTQEVLQKALGICRFFDCRRIRIGVGPLKTPADYTRIEQWLAFVDEQTFAYNVIPIVDIVHDWNPAHLTMLVRKYRRLRLRYDPGQLLSNKTHDPFTRYWVLFRSSIGVLDLHDFSARTGPVPIGHGDAKLDLTLQDTRNQTFLGLYCLETGLPPREPNSNWEAYLKIAHELIDNQKND